MGEPELPESYDTSEIEMPDTYFENIRAADEVDSPLYNLWQGQLYDTLRASEYCSPADAAQVSRFLNRREIDEAEELTETLLESEE
jgi:hypothetical protein